MANIIYDSFYEKLMENLLTYNIKCALLQGISGTHPYTPSLSHVFFSDVSASEITGVGYTSGGKLLTNKTITGKKFDADNPQWLNSTITYAYAVFYIDSGNPATSKLIVLADLGGEKSKVNATAEIEINSSGLITFGQSS